MGLVNDFADSAFSSIFQAIGDRPQPKGYPKTRRAKLCFRTFVEAVVGSSRFRLRSGCWHQGPQSASVPGPYPTRWPWQFSQEFFPRHVLEDVQGARSSLLFCVMGARRGKFSITKGVVNR